MNQAPVASQQGADAQPLRVWQQNLNKSLKAQLDMLQSLKPERYDVALIQEPHIDFRHKSRTNIRFITVYPTSHAQHPELTRSLILVNACLPSSSWTQIPIASSDLTGIELNGEFGIIRIINVYNDCKHNNSLDILLRYLRDPANAARPGRPILYIWGGDFNRHHPMWDEMRNWQLFTNHNLALTEPLLDMLARFSMIMALPRDIPTLQAKGNGNYTRPDNVFCSSPLLSSFVSCDTAPALRPIKTDHLPIIYELDIRPSAAVLTPRPLWRKTEWDEFRAALLVELSGIPRCASYDTREEVDAAITAVRGAIRRCVDAHVPVSKPSPHQKRWWSELLTRLKRESQRALRDSYRHRMVPEHPIHEEARIRRNLYAEAVQEAKTVHWVEWLEGLNATDVFAAGRLASGPPSDGGRARVPTLRIVDPVTHTITEATSNKAKSEMFYREFFPPKRAASLVPPNPVYPPPAFKMAPISDALLHRVITKMKPYKATRQGSFANCVYVFNAHLLVPFLGPIYRALDTLEYYPKGWNSIDSIVLRKPGKPNYADPSAYRPVVLSEDDARILHSVKTTQLTIGAERAGLLPDSQYGARPGRSTNDALHMVVKIIKDAWRRGEVASVLCMDVKGAFPSVDLDRLVHDLRVIGIPRELTEWLVRRYEGRTSRIVFDDYTSDPFEVVGGLDQGDPISGIAYLLYNSGLAEIPNRANGEHDVKFVDDFTIIATAPDFVQTHEKIIGMIQRNGGVDMWADEHNAVFGPAKYQLLDASRRRQPHWAKKGKTVPVPRRSMKLGRYTIKSMKSVKLLGLHLDRELRWREQGSAALGKGQAWLSQVGRLARPSRGVKAGPMRRLYLSTCVPRMLYGADVFLNPETEKARGSPKRAILGKLASIQRRAALLVTGALSSSPSDALNAFANLLPIRHLVDKVRHNAALRLVTLPTTHPLHDAVVNAGKRYVKDHKTPLHHLMNEFSLQPGKMEKIQAVRFNAEWESSMAVSIRSSKDEGVADDAEDHARWKVYTDGSGIDGKIGAAAVLYRDGVEVRTSRKRLGSERRHTVFEGEGVGGNLGLGLLWAERDVEGDATIAVDSTPAINATRSTKSRPSSYIWDLWHRHARVVQRKHPGIRITIRWCPGHRDVTGNERADAEAKRAAQEGSSAKSSIPPAFRDTMPWSRSATKQAFNKALKAKVAAEWRGSPRHHRVKRYDPTLPSAKFIQLTDRLSRKQAVILLQLRLGHTILNKHLHRIGRADSPICPCCHQADETVIHYLLHCPAHSNARAELHRTGGRLTRDINQLLRKPKLLPHLFQFIARSGRFRTVFGDLPPVRPPED